MCLQNSKKKIILILKDHILIQYAGIINLMIQE